MLVVKRNLSHSLDLSISFILSLYFSFFPSLCHTHLTVSGIFHSLRWCNTHCPPLKRRVIIPIYTCEIAKQIIFIASIIFNEIDPQNHQTEWKVSRELNEYKIDWILYKKNANSNQMRNWRQEKKPKWLVNPRFFFCMKIKNKEAHKHTWRSKTKARNKKWMGTNERRNKWFYATNHAPWI